ncbi:hypothetical protein F5I97DRAFT_1930541 [Phlebopus sp. FC_14]|nr:hypothetical protein F5I97DRAFT_1930541 [Phlebopus sp. FC_14]
MSTTRSFIFFALSFSVSAAPLLPDTSQQRPHIVPFWPWPSPYSDTYGLLPVRQAIQLLIDTEQGVSTHSDVLSSPAADILAPYEHAPSLTPIPHANTTLAPHATHPASSHQRSRATLIVGTVFGAILALFMLWFFARVFMRKRSSFSLSNESDTHITEPFHEPHSKGNRFSDESWLQSSPQPTLKLETTACPVLACPPRSLDLQLRTFTFPGTKLIPVTTPTSASTTVFSSSTELRSNETGEQTHSDSETESPLQSPMCSIGLFPSPFPIPPNSPPPSPLQTSPDPSPTNSEAGKPLILSSPRDNLDLPAPSRLSRLLASSFYDDHTSSFRKRSTPHGIVDLRTIRAHVHRRSRSATNSLYARAQFPGRTDCGGIARSTTSMNMVRDSVYGPTKSGIAFATRARPSTSYVHLTSLADEVTIPNHFPDHWRDTMATITTITTQETMSTSNVSYLLREAGAGTSYSEHHSDLVDVSEREQDCVDSFTGSGSISVSGIRTVTPSLSVSASAAVSLSPSMASSITGVGLGIMRMDANVQERVRAKEKQRERARERGREALREREGQRCRTRGTFGREKARERGWKPPGSPSSCRTPSSASSSRSNSPSPVPSVSLTPSILKENFPFPSNVSAFSNSTPRFAETPSPISRTRASTVSEVDLYALPDPDYSSPSPTLSNITARFPTASSVTPTRAPTAGRGGTRKRLVGKPVPSTVKMQKRPPSIHGRTKSAPVSSS